MAAPSTNNTIFERSLVAALRSHNDNDGQSIGVFDIKNKT
jgi:hypothetical protein